MHRRLAGKLTVCTKDVEAKLRGLAQWWEIEGSFPDTCARYEEPQTGGQLYRRPLRSIEAELVITTSRLKQFI